LDDVFDRLPLNETDRRHRQRRTDGGPNGRVELPANHPGDRKGNERQR